MLSFGFLEQCIIFEFGSNIFIIPIHAKFNGALSVNIKEF